MLSHDEEGKAIHLWRAHSLRPAGDGSVPKVIEEAFVKVSGITAGMLDKKSKELLALMHGELARRKAQLESNERELNRLKPAASRGDAEAKAEIDRLLEQRVAISSAPLEERDDFFAFQKSYVDESHYHPVLVARSDPMAAYVAQELRAHLTAASLPETFR